MPRGIGPVQDVAVYRLYAETCAKHMNESRSDERRGGGYGKGGGVSLHAEFFFEDILEMAQFAGTFNYNLPKQECCISNH